MMMVNISLTQRNNISVEYSEMVIGRGFLNRWSCQISEESKNKKYIFSEFCLRMNLFNSFGTGDSDLI